MISANQHSDISNLPVRRRYSPQRWSKANLIYRCLPCFDGGLTTSDLSERNVSDGKLEKDLDGKKSEKKLSIRH